MTSNHIMVAALSTWTYASWSMVAHHLSHGGYNRVNMGKYNSRGFAIGSIQRRISDWTDWMYPEAWNVKHNRLHWCSAICRMEASWKRISTQHGSIASSPHPLIAAVPQNEAQPKINEVVEAKDFLTRVFAPMFVSRFLLFYAFRPCHCESRNGAEIHQNDKNTKVQQETLVEGSVFSGERHVLFMLVLLLQKHKSTKSTKLIPGKMGP